MILRILHALQRWRLRRMGFQTRLIETDEGPMRAMELRGSGPLPTLVVVHGICAEGAEFVDTLKHLRHHFSRILLPDLPGHGLSADPKSGLTPDSLKDAAIDLLETLVDEPALILGNSLGGLVALRFAQHAPDRVRALYLSSPGGGRMPEVEFPTFLERLRPKSWADGVAFAVRIHKTPPWHRWLIGGAVRSLFARAAMARFVDAMRWDDLLQPEEISTLKPPVYLAWGKRDQLLPQNQLAYFQQNLPAGAVVETPDWGHCPYLDSPRPFADSILRWARSVSL